MALVEYDVCDGVAHIELNRPDTANAFDLETTREFATAVARAGEDRDVRAVLVSGAGPRFCAGGDVAAFAATDDQPAYIHQLATELDAAYRALNTLEKPVVAAVHGAVAGAGLAFMLSCDVVIAASGTKFVFAYPGIGFTLLTSPRDRAAACPRVLPGRQARVCVRRARLGDDHRGRRRRPGTCRRPRPDAGGRASDGARSGAAAAPPGVGDGPRRNRCRRGPHNHRDGEGAEAQALIPQFVSR